MKTAIALSVRGVACRAVDCPPCKREDPQARSPRRPRPPNRRRRTPRPRSTMPCRSRTGRWPRRRATCCSPSIRIREAAKRVRPQLRRGQGQGRRRARRTCAPRRCGATTAETGQGRQAAVGRDLRQGRRRRRRQRREAGAPDLPRPSVVGTQRLLVLQAGDFRCSGGCRVQVKVDEAPAEGDGRDAPEDRRGDRDVHRGRARAVADDERTRR